MSDDLQELDHIKASLCQITEQLYEKIQGNGSDAIEDGDDIPCWSAKDDLLTILTKILVLKNKIQAIDSSNDTGQQFQFDEQTDLNILEEYCKKISK